jgi:ethanolamine transporter EutH
MVAFMILGAAVGLILGAHFKMFALGAAIPFACAATVAAGFINGMDAHTIVLAVLAVLVSLQVAYVVGGVAAAYFSVQIKLPHRTWRPSQYY